MKRVLTFREENRNIFDYPLDAPSILECPRGWPSAAVKKKIVNYLASRNHFVVSSTRPSYIDAFTGDVSYVNGDGYRDDADWRWSDETIYYVEEHDVLVAPEFLDHVLDCYAGGFRPENPVLKWKNRKHRQRNR